METKTENSAAGSVISNRESPYPAEKLIHYQTALALMDGLLRDNGLSVEDHKIARALLACHYGLDLCSIFR